MPYLSASRGIRFLRQRCGAAGIFGVVQFVIARSPAARDDEAIQLDRDACEAAAATARFAHLAMTMLTVSLPISPLV